MKNHIAGTIIAASLALCASGCSGESQASPENNFVAGQTRPKSSEPAETQKEKAEKIVEAAPGDSAQDKAESRQKAQALSDEEKFIRDRMEKLESAFGDEADPAEEQRKFVASTERTLESAKTRVDLLLSESEALTAETQNNLKDALAKAEKALADVKGATVDQWEGFKEGASAALAELEIAYDEGLVDLND